MTTVNDDETPLSAALRRRKLKYFPEFFYIARDLISAKMATLDDSDDSGSFDGEPDRHKITAPLHDSNIVGSELVGKAYQPGLFDTPRGMAGERMHKPVLDIDIPIWARESTTPGHWHLIIDKELTETEYFRLLDVLAEVGIVEKPFVNAAKSRGASWIRVPWVKKKKDTDGPGYEGTEKEAVTTGIGEKENG